MGPRLRPLLPPPLCLPWSMLTDGAKQASWGRPPQHGQRALPRQAFAVARTKVNTQHDTQRRHNTCTHTT